MEAADGKDDFSRWPDRNHNYTVFTPYEQLRKYLNGYVRIQQYEVTMSDVHNVYDPQLESSQNRLQRNLIMLTEGQMFNGSLNGYGRRFYKDIECQVGYWKDSLPYGKFILFENGIVNTGCQGIWNGWGRIPYKAQLSVKLADFMVNYEPPEKEYIYIDADTGEEVKFTPEPKENNNKNSTSDSATPVTPSPQSKP